MALIHPMNARVHTGIFYTLKILHPFVFKLHSIHDSAFNEIVHRI